MPGNLAAVFKECVVLHTGGSPWQWQAALPHAVVRHTKLPGSAKPISPSKAAMRA